MSNAFAVFAPTDVVDAIYGNVPGAKFNTTTNVYNVPCDTKLDVSFGFGYARHYSNNYFVYLFCDYLQWPNVPS